MVSRPRFQSTRPRRARRDASRPVDRRERFNPRAREGRDALRRQCGRTDIVSIHAPAKGATTQPAPPRDQWTVSIHAPAKGATCARGLGGGAGVMFQSTRPRRARRGAGKESLLALEVSIHAPAKGATVRRAVREHCERQVSIHAPAKGATLTSQITCSPRVFQSTRPRRARPGRTMTSTSRWRFQSTRPRRARPSPVPDTDTLGRFNPRAREGRDVICSSEAVAATLFQSTRPRRARHIADGESGNCEVVSIHAPAKGATWQPMRPPASFSMFQSTRPRRARLAHAAAPRGVHHVSSHAPAKGATCRLATLPIRCWVFQSTRPRRARPAHRPSSLIARHVSIHAPAKGATCRLATLPIRCWVFQSTRPRRARPAHRPSSLIARHVSIHAPAKGATHLHVEAHRGTQCFNPRAREGRDEALESRTPYDRSFNPRAREGRDSGLIASQSPKEVSIHAPAKGATARSGLDLDDGEVSIHAPAKGATGSGRDFKPVPEGFNPRAREGRDTDRCAKGVDSRGFNPRAREGRDVLPDPVGITRTGVSIHAPAKGATPAPELSSTLNIPFQSTRPRRARPWRYNSRKY